MAKKTKYDEWLTDDNIKRIEAWARDGLIDDEISAKMGIARSTLSEWKVKYKRIGDALKRGKEVVDIEVENSLLKRALGYKYKEKTSELVKNDLGEYELKVTKVVEKEVMPDTTACIYWLQNRKPDEWKDKRTPNNLKAIEKVDEVLQKLEEESNADK